MKPNENDIVYCHTTYNFDDQYKYFKEQIYIKGKTYKITSVGPTIGGSYGIWLEHNMSGFIYPEEYNKYFCDNLKNLRKEKLKNLYDTNTNR